jgi:hypothetical protein
MVLNGYMINEIEQMGKEGINGIYLSICPEILRKTT